MLVLLLVEMAGEYEGDEGLMMKEDLAAYRPVWREPLVGGYRGLKVIAMPPTSGGIAVIEMLNILEGFDLSAQSQSSAVTYTLAGRGRDASLRRP